MKTCTSGAKCKHDDGPDLPESEFYGNSKGGLKSQCKDCIKYYQSVYDSFESCIDNQSRIDNLKSTHKNYRLGRIYTLIKDGLITRSDFRTIMRAVEV